jgi:D-lactate dehydrogenase (cytochrome)
MLKHALPTQLFDKRQLITDPVELITFEVDAGFDRGRPDGVFYPRSAAEVSQIMRWASEHQTPLIARGAGTGLSGGAVAEHGGIIVEFAHLNRVLEFDSLGRSAVVQPGVTNLALDGLVKKAGLYYPPDPSSGRSSVIGGNIGENAGGPHCFKYGVTTNYVTGLEVVLADGQVVHLGGRALDYPEYDFCGLMVGSEGTLGLITQAEVRLLRNPPGVKTMMVSFASLKQAGEAVSAVITAGLLPATLEMMDQKIMRMIEAYAAPGLPIDAEAALIVEVDGHPASLDAQIEEVADILTQHGGYDPRIARSEEERQKIWYGRKSAAGAMSRLAPSFYLVDVTVPRSRLADMLAAVDQVCHRYDLKAGHVFHAGDGNLHPLILCDARNPELMERVFRACDEIVTLCLEREGSITGEHGVGIEKRRYMPAMYSGAELSAMLDIKQLFDPHYLFNPGKIFPDEPVRPDYVTPALPSSHHFAPASAQETAAGLRALAQVRRPVYISRTAQRSATDQVWLSTEQMAGIYAFAPNDLSVTVGAGTTVQTLQQFLAEHQMQTPLVTPWPEATIGGVLATNLNAPLRMRYGALRDLLLSTTVALCDGRVIRAGRSVVKNVAGYDLPKLFVGSYGTLGVLTDATLKLTPLPRSQRTLATPVAGLGQGVEWALQLLPHLLVTSGVVLAQGESGPGLASAPFTLLITAEGIPEDVEAELTEVAAALTQLGAGQPVEVTPLTASEQWGCVLRNTQPESLLVRIALPVKELAGYVGQLPSDDDRTHWLVDAPNGMLYGRCDGASRETAQLWLERLRQPALARGGYVIALSAPPTLHGAFDPWGYQPSTRAWMQRLKAHWDPAGVLNAGVFVV